MKKIAFFSLAIAMVLCSMTTWAQSGDKSKRASPPATLTAKVNDVNLTIDYSQPAVNGRTMGTDIAPYGKVWRTGANEATTFTVNKDVKVEGKDLKAGTYSLYTIPGQDEWTVIFNSVAKQWGTVYDESKDVLRVKVKPTKAATFTERMTFSQEANNVVLAWGDTAVRFTVQ